jgi:PAS domain S-box-containing protein
MTQPTVPPILEPVKSPRWHLIYYALAGFDLVTVAATLLLSFTILNIYVDSVDQNRVMATRASNLSDMSMVLITVNAPGNDVFEKQNPKQQRLLLDQYHKQFEILFEEIRLDMALIRDPFLTKKIHEQLQVVKAEELNMVAYSIKALEFFDKGKKSKAGRSMAIMDQHFGAASTALNGVSHSIRDQQNIALDNEILKAKKLSQYEYVIVVFIMLMIFCVIVYGRYITKRIKITDKKLKKANHDNAALLATLNSQAIISMADRAGSITSVSEAFCAISGYSREELEGNNHRLVKSDVQPDEFWVAVWAKISRGILWRGMVCNLTKDGSYYWVDTVITPFLDEHGKLEYYISIGIDVTANKHNELALEQALEDAKMASASKSQFLASMSHEIRTPMNGVIGMLHLLSKEALSIKQQHYTQTAKSSADSLLIIINDILDVTKIEAGKLDIEMIDFDLHSLFKDLAGTMAHRVHEKGLDFILDIDGIKNTMVQGDPGRVRQILTNLLGNAIKFTHQGEIVVRASFIDIDGDRENLHLRSEIIDTGIGIPSDKAGQLFESFTQADSSTTRQYGGTGLGLSIVKQLCQLMGGDVDVKSEQDKGSQFGVSLILGRSQVVLPPIPSIDMAGTQMLIVDDNHTNIEVLSGLLEKKSIALSVCNSGLECLNLLEQHTLESGPCPFKIAILDMQMPNMDGAELAKLIRNNPQYNGMRLVLLTSEGDRGDAHFYADIGFDAYLHKPIIAQDLYDTLALTLGHSDTHSTADSLLTRRNILAIRDNTSTEDAQHQLAQHVNKRLLLVEDNAINQMVAISMLEDFGLSADVSSNGLEAITALQQADEAAPYALILMDCQMPIMDGYQATHNIRNGDAGDHNRDIIIVAMTAGAMQGDREKCIDSGMNDYLSKPIDENPLADCLVKWLCADNESMGIK